MVPHAFNFSTQEVEADSLCEGSLVYIQTSQDYKERPCLKKQKQNQFVFIVLTTLYMCECIWVCQSAHMEVRAQLSGICFYFCGF